MIAAGCPVSAQEVGAHYDELDAFYREIWGEHLHHGLWERGDETPEEAVVNLVRHALRGAHVGVSSRVCDVGCGYGATARLLALEYGATVCAVTVSAAQYCHAISQTAGAANPRYFLCDWLSNDLPSEAFDAVVAIESSEHMQDKENFFSEACRVLARKGRLVVCAWIATETAGFWQRRYLLEPICREGRIPALGTESDYRRWLSDAGLALESFEDLSAKVRRTWTICAWRLLLKLIRRSDYRRFLFNPRANNRIFGATILRIGLAYALRGMRYGMFIARKESPQD
jgi:tocopherol O-methyltransferase